MKLLLTSGGVKNPSIRAALDDLLPKPVGECSALCVTTSSYALRNGVAMAYDFIATSSGTPMTDLGWKSLGVLELTALPSLPAERWRAWVEASDVLLVNGGDPMYLCYWMRRSGLADMLSSYAGVYVALSAGSMIMAPRIGTEFVGWKPPAEFDPVAREQADGDGGDLTLGIVDFAMFPHLEHPALPHNTMANAKTWAAKLTGPAYAVDDDTAFKVVDGSVEVVSEGQWRLLNG
ncbi:MAG TPA: Type 1 glutamine amidotransferase-like domain-containing protein [Trueperaceae bacterium]|nr:Type 1 glutamine amidotransferase-like domain-containing protein [Trueperaceae bacterium]